jgi:hypothetical protein
MISEIEIATSFCGRTRNDRRRKELLFFDRLRMTGKKKFFVMTGGKRVSR